MNILQKVTLPFTILGALNWGLVAIFDFNLVTAIFGNLDIGIKITYIFIALCALVNIMIFFVDLNTMKKKTVIKG